MQILALMTDAFGGYGGIAQYNRDLVTALAQFPSAPAVTVLPRMTSGSLGVLPDRTRQAAPRQGRLRYSAAALAAALRWRPDVVINGHLYHGPLAYQVARLMRAPMVSIVHGTEIWGELRPLHLRPLTTSARVLCVSRDTERCILAAAPQLSGRTALTFNTVGAQFTPGDRRAAREKLGLGAECAILTVARLDSRTVDGRVGYKGHDRVIACLKALCAERPVRYLIAGVGDDEARLRQVAAEAGVADRVRFLGKVPAADLPDLYRAADLFALPSIGEGFGIVYLEAMASGTPAIGLDVGGAPDALGHGISGLSLLGTVASVSDFPAALSRAVARAKGHDDSDRTNLSAQVHAAFGQGAFAKRVAAALANL